MFRRVASRVIQGLAERAARRTLDRLEQSTLLDEIAYRAASETALAGLRDDETPHDRFQHISDEYWHWLLTAGIRRNTLLRRFLPGLPAEELQLRFTGDAGDDTLREACAAYRLFRDTYEKHSGPLAAQSRILDYGCGWGRIIRYFLKDVPTLTGADPVEEVLDAARLSNRWCRFIKIPFAPPTGLDGTFDLIYSFSVFSHLSEERAGAVVRELAEMLAPGGLAMLTTRSRRFIEYCAKLRTDARLAAGKPGHTSSAAAFPDTAEIQIKYDAGEYCFHSFAASGDWAHWGETAIPRAYVERNWKMLELVEFIDDPSRLAQSVIVLRRVR